MVPSQTLTIILVIFWHCKEATCLFAFLFLWAQHSSSSKSACTNRVMRGSILWTILCADRLEEFSDACSIMPRVKSQVMKVKAAMKAMKAARKKPVKAETDEGGDKRGKRGKAGTLSRPAAVVQVEKPPSCWAKARVGKAEETGTTGYPTDDEAEEVDKVSRAMRYWGANCSLYPYHMHWKLILKFNRGGPSETIVQSIKKLNVAGPTPRKSRLNLRCI